MKIFEKKPASSAESDVAATARLLAVVNRSRLEPYPEFEPPAPETVERRFWTPDELLAATA